MASEAKKAWWPALVLLFLAVLLPALTTPYDPPDWIPLLLIFVPLVLALGILWRSLAGDWLGPHFFYDILRLARRGRSIGVRVLFVAALLVGLGFLFWGRFRHRNLVDMLFESGPSVSNNDLSRLAEMYVFTIIVLQNLAVLVLAPAYIAGSVVEERERRTLELLFTSHLNNREIIFGKLLSRLFHLGGILLAGLPILSLSQLLGGVDMGLLVANFVNTFLNLMSVGSVCILVSVLSRSSFLAVITSYGIILPFAACFSCLSVNGSSSLLALWPGDFAANASGVADTLWVSMSALIVVHLFISGICLAVAVAALRNSGDVPVLTPRMPEYEYRPSSALPLEEQIVKPKEVLQGLPPIDDQPLLWKEMYLGGPSFALSPAVWAPMASFLIPLGLLFFFHLLDSQVRNEDFWQGSSTRNPIFRFFLILFAGLFCLGVAYRACVSMVRERQQQTLDALLLLPITDIQLLGAKWYGSIYRGWSWSIYFGITLVLALITLSVHFLGLVLLTAAVVVHALFFASFGLYLSIVSKTVLAANMRMALSFMAVVVVGTFALVVSDHTGPGLVDSFLLFGLNPVANWYEFGFSYVQHKNNPYFFQNLIGAAMGTMVYGILAYGFWVLVNRTFAKEKYRQGGFRA